MVSKNGQWAVYSPAKEAELTDFSYSQFTNQSTYGCRCLRSDSGWEMITALGERIGEIYEHLKDYESDVVPVQNNGKWGFVDCKSKKVLYECKFDRVLRFFGHEAVVMYLGEDMKVSFE
jgi:hypothetical protein